MQNTVKEETPDEGNVININTRQITGGPTKPENWLESLRVSVTFACRPKVPTIFGGKEVPQWLLQELQVFSKHDKCTQLYSMGKEPFMVDTRRFSEEHELVEIIDDPYETDP